MLDECREARSDFFGQFHFVRIQERGREQQGASIVVDTVTMGAVLHRMDRVLEHPRTVAEREKMPDP